VSFAGFRVVALPLAFKIPFCAAEAVLEMGFLELGFLGFRFLANNDLVLVGIVIFSKEKG
jgi:hypothetical protein